MPSTLRHNPFSVKSPLAQAIERLRNCMQQKDNYHACIEEYAALAGELRHTTRTAREYVECIALSKSNCTAKRDRLIKAMETETHRDVKFATELFVQMTQLLNKK